MHKAAPPLAFQYTPLNTLKPNPHNARTHSKRQIRLIAASIKTFGFLNPLIVDRYQQIIAGHGRWEAAQQLGLSEVPTVQLEHLTADQIRAYVIADNRLAEIAGWDRDLLAIELQHLISLDLDFDIEITGFNVTEIDSLTLPTSKQEAAEEVATEDLGPPVTKVGDSWTLGRHLVRCGDAREEMTYRQLLSGQKADAVFTDPPYNVRIHGHASGLGKIRHREFAMACGEMSDADFVEFLSTVCLRLARHSRPGSLHYLCIDWRHLRELLEAGLSVYRELKNLCVWVKDVGGMGSFYRSQHELVCVFKHGAVPHRNNIELGKHGRNRTNVWTYSGVNAFARQTDEGRLADLHPTIKPVPLVADVLLDCTARGEVVLDPFLGSGTTLIAAERVGRVCRGLELDPRYVDVVVRRWQRYTGEAAVHTETGQRFDKRSPEKAHG